MKRRIFWYVVAAAGIVSLSACKDESTNQYGGTPGPGTSPYTVTMAYTAFSPSSLTVPRGTTVTWRNNDSMAHTSTSNTGVWNTGNIAPGGSSTTRFDSLGTYSYHCAIHPSMTGTITVQ